MIDEVLKFLASIPSKPDMDKRIIQLLIVKINKADSLSKLPKLVLLTEIAKRETERFKKHLEPRLLQIFCQTFLKNANGDYRLELMKIFKSWRGIFSDKTLNGISDRLKLSDIEKELTLKSNNSPKHNVPSITLKHPSSVAIQENMRERQYSYPSQLSSQTDFYSQSIDSEQAHSYENLGCSQPINASNMPGMHLSSSPTQSETSFGIYSQTDLMHQNSASGYWQPQDPQTNLEESQNYTYYKNLYEQMLGMIPMVEEILRKGKTCGVPPPLGLPSLQKYSEIGPLNIDQYKRICEKQG
ncbi:unnamed protein product [Moneuplotes crassus]|uniref:CID domain-containing protein n=1 Tax=Euplotes crassus TaxID=5936 RepID=A0AAD1U5E5_EUPCR|nr:unnamed protein product [Moneuplotes crassus]